MPKISLKDLHQYFPLEFINLKDPSNWNNVRNRLFNYEQINLNIANLGLDLTSEIIPKEKRKEISINPLNQYELGRFYYEKNIKLAKKLFFVGNFFETEITVSSSQLSSLISRSIKNQNARILTTKFEHEGGLSSFENNHNCHKVNIYQLLTKEIYQKIKPDFIIISSALYKTGELLPLKNIWEISKKYSPNSILILDAAQTLGVYKIDMNYCDISFASFHKWCHGPKGFGIISYKKNQKLLEKCFFGSDITVKNNFFTLSGGQDFFKYLEIYFILKLFSKLTLNKILKRLIYLKSSLKDYLDEFGVKTIDYKACHDGILTVKSNRKNIYFQYKKLQKQGIYVKCFAETGKFRLSIPFFESDLRLKKAAKIIGETICLKK